MALTIKEALKFGGLFGASVVAGEKGLDKQVESVSVLEVAESNISQWALKNQLYITSFYAIRDNAEQQKIVIKTLIQCGCCGLVLCYVGTWIRQIADEIIQMCNDAEFPLIQARTDVSYIEIMNPIINLLYEENSESMLTNDYSVIRNDFLRLIVNEENTKNVLGQMNRRINRKISYFDTYGKVIFSDRDLQEVEEEEAYLEQHFYYILYECSNKGYTVQTIGKKERLLVLIRSQKNLFGLFIMDYEKELLEKKNQDLLTSLVVSGALIMRKRNQTIDFQEKAVQEYVADLLVWNFPSNKKAVERGEELGLSIVDKNQIVLININSIQQRMDAKMQLEIQNYVKRVIFSQIDGYVKSHNPQNWLVLRSDTLILFLACEKNQPDMYKFCKYLMELFGRKLNLSISIGVSNRFQDIIKLPEAYQQAFQAAVLGRKYYGENKIILYESVYFFQKLKQLGAIQESKEIGKKLLEPIREHDKNYHADLVKTLQCLLENGGNTMRAAQAMYVHKNTILQRKAKIIELLGYSPFEMPDLLKFLIVFDILD